MTQTVHVFHQPASLLIALQRELDGHASNPLSSSATQLVSKRRWDSALGAALREYLGRPAKEFRGEFTKTFFRLVNNRDEIPHDLPLVVEALHAGSLVVDDIQDDSEVRRGRPSLHRLCGVPMALNVGNWLYFWAAELLWGLHLPDARRVQAQTLFNRCLIDCHYGQALDLSQRASSLSQEELPATVLATTELKSGSLVALSGALGALVGGADEASVLAAHQFGRDVGTALQMLDDLSGVSSVGKVHKGVEDLRNDRPTWVWAWLAMSQSTAQFQRLRSMAASIADGGCPGLFIAEVRMLLKPQIHGIQKHLHTAVERLETILPVDTNFTELKQALQRLERSYV